MSFRLVGRFTVCCIIAATTVAFLGCGDGTPVGTVSGTVTSQGQPVTEAQVSFRSTETGKGNIATLDSSGEFALPEALEVGTYTVSVTPPAPPAPDLDAGPQPPPKQYDNIPQKYRSELTSPLKAEVREGENKFPFELE